MKITIEIKEKHLRAMRDFYPHDKLLSDKEFATLVVQNMVEMAVLNPDKCFDPVMF